ncbi:hypothetical protein RAAC3_TM7C00001G0192 [Candidatus Saccharibacteria bacterium RAAC3_TM7_1]|nr:hypothetical protein RAAC3_TM7C00001G0192 [Candidatus Saccharibacteria bacterium RAAC3_TM7_1]HCZ28770.1 hypothetical protein [Candidatus Saccharibacteria bacterium]
MSKQKSKLIIGRLEYVWIVPTNQKKVPARIDTGARTTAIWASSLSEEDGILSWSFFGKDSPFYTGQLFHSKSYKKRVVANSTGHKEVRYLIPITLQLKGRRVRTKCTLANRQTQAFPILIGRNTLAGKFIVDVQHGSKKLSVNDQVRFEELQSELENE